MKAIQTKLKNRKFWKNSEVVLGLWKDSETPNKYLRFCGFLEPLCMRIAQRTLKLGLPRKNFHINLQLVLTIVSKNRKKRAIPKHANIISITSMMFQSFRVGFKENSKKFGKRKKKKKGSILNQ